MQRTCPNHSATHNQLAFTIVELIVVIILIGVLSAVALPRFFDVSTEARIAALESIAGSMRTTASMTQAKARLEGIRPVSSNPGSGQANYIIESELGASELHFSNLCPESSAELGDRLDMGDYMAMSLTDDVTITTDNQYVRIGFEITGNTSSGCYVLYDSFAAPDCTIEVISTDC